MRSECRISPAWTARQRQDIADHGDCGNTRLEHLRDIAGAAGVGLGMTPPAKCADPACSLDDANLNQLVGSIPPGAIVLMEDMCGCVAPASQSRGSRLSDPTQRLCI